MQLLPVLRRNTAILAGRARRVGRTAQAIVVLVLAAVALAGCGANNGQAHLGSTACKRAELITEQADDAGIAVPQAPRVTAKYHCDHDVEADHTVLRNTLYPQNVDTGACTTITTAPELNAAHELDDAECISLWADRVVFALNGPQECIAPLNLEKQRQTQTAQYQGLLIQCLKARDAEKSRSDAISQGFGIAILSIIGLGMAWLFMFAGGPLTDTYMRNRS